MKIISLFFRLIRWPNLAFIFLTQFLFQYCVLLPILSHAGIEPQVHTGGFILLTSSFVLIAAAGYIINDYYDLPIDLVNKPGKVFITKGLAKRSAMAWYLFMNAVALACGLYVNRRMPDHCILITVAACIFALFIYSARLKKKLLMGNMLVAAVTASSVMVLGCAEGIFSLALPKLTHSPALHSVFRLTILYTGFAFVISLIREVVKDIEDMEGDQKFGCSTMPVVWGVRATRLFIASWIILLMAALIYTQVYLIRGGEWLLSGYALVLIILPLAFILKKLFDARDAKDYHWLSNGIKLVMLAGILSMLLIRHLHFLQ